MFIELTEGTRSKKILINVSSLNFITPYTFPIKKDKDKTEGCQIKILGEDFVVEEDYKTIVQMLEDAYRHAES